MEKILECTDLTKRFSYNKKSSFAAVDGVSLSIFKGETYGLVGESGSGKSTLANMIASLEKADSGQILFKGEEIPLHNREKMLNFRKEMQIIFQAPYATLNPRHKIGFIIEEGLKIHKIGSSQKERLGLVNEMRTLIGLPPDSLEKFPSELSGGQRQRVAIASAMILRPEFVICDECVSSLDVLIQAQILNLLKGMQKSLNLTYLFISHNLNVVVYMADRIGVMYHGKIVEEKPTNELLKNPEHQYTKKLLQAVNF
ncbi:ABC transporter ATP-binding protein [uncultured Treponema sp.]|uniref:ATP-binding cassette domain-containing protein n=1 Tax=uncultured Treponema sp. TaxID=162155 RepID=UPI0025E9AA06|nr:ABC transporter ATP-binding protein [uncultured Treponema sp.]